MHILFHEDTGKIENKWTSPEIQNDLIEIVSSLVLTRDIKSNGHYRIIICR